MCFKTDHGRGEGGQAGPLPSNKQGVNLTSSRTQLEQREVAHNEMISIHKRKRMGYPRAACIKRRSRPSKANVPHRLWPSAEASHHRNSPFPPRRTGFSPGYTTNPSAHGCGTLTAAGETLEAGETGAAVSVKSVGGWSSRRMIELMR
jgi:hypothetical protein